MSASDAATRTCSRYLLCSHRKRPELPELEVFSVHGLSLAGLFAVWDRQECAEAVLSALGHPSGWESATQETPL